ncbi:hypothetical protein [Nocardia brasiliensis]|uniref:hypothetical protein n=1 Tax=Nocardia brasiliensis TaxID=37326 RepID=UPI003D92033B
MTGVDPDYISSMEHFESMRHEEIYAKAQQIDAAEVLRASVAWLEVAGTLSTSFPLTRTSTDRVMNSMEWQGAAADAAFASTRSFAASVDELAAIMGQVGARLGGVAAAAEAVKIAVAPPGGSGPIGAVAKLLEAAHVIDAQMAEEALRQEAVLAMNMVYKPAYSTAGKAVPALPGPPQLPGIQSPPPPPKQRQAPQYFPQDEQPSTPQDSYPSAPNGQPQVPPNGQPQAPPSPESQAPQGPSTPPTTQAPPTQDAPPTTQAPPPTTQQAPPPPPTTQAPPPPPPPTHEPPAPPTRDAPPPAPRASKRRHPRPPANPRPPSPTRAANRASPAPSPRKTNNNPRRPPTNPAWSRPRSRPNPPGPPHIPAAQVPLSSRCRTGSATARPRRPGRTACRRAPPPRNSTNGAPRGGRSQRSCAERGHRMHAAAPILSGATEFADSDYQRAQCAIRGSATPAAAATTYVVLALLPGCRTRSGLPQRV